MKNELKYKLRKYSVATGGIIFNNVLLDAQINYSDIPDLVISPPNYYDTLDLNLDSIDEVVFGDNMNMVSGTFSSGPYTDIIIFI